MIKDYFLLAFKNLKHRGIRSWLTVLGIFIGIAAVVALVSLGSGLEQTISAQFGVSNMEVITIQAGGLNNYGPPGSGAVNPLKITDLEKIREISGVKRAIGRNIRSVKMEFNDNLIFGFAVSVPEGEDRKWSYEEMDLDVEVGRMLEDGDGKLVVLGNNYLKEDNEFEKPIKRGDKIKIQDENFDVVGILERQGSFIFDNMAMINEDILEDLLGYGEEIDIIAVQVEDVGEMDLVKERIEEELRKSRGVKKGEEDFEVSTPEAAMETVNQVLTGVQIFVIMIALISIFVGAIGIVNTMTTSVLERRKEIGIMKAVGAKNSHIFTLFLIESGLMGLIGGLAGVVVGESIGYVGTIFINNFIGVSTKPIINFIFIGFVLLGSFLIGAISGITPALRAANQNVVEALRG